MTVFQNETIINQPISKVYQFLADFNNHEQLMPDNVLNWSSTSDQAKFTIKSITALVLNIIDREVDSHIVIVPSEPTPFKLLLRWELEYITNEETKVRFLVSADLNMMLKMVASKPLQKLVDYEVESLRSCL